MTVLLLLLPCALLLLALFAGRYPGEQLLGRVSLRRARRARREPEQEARPAVPEFRKPCAGRLVASSLDSRAPPGRAVPQVARATA